MAKDTPDKSANILSDMDNLERSIVQVQEMLENVSAYVDAVLVCIAPITFCS